MKAKFFHARLFLEGIEVPLVSATYNGGVNSDGVLSIQIPYSDKVFGIKPRTLVVLLYRDEDGTYRGGYAAEVVGVGVVRSPVGRSVVLQCIGLTNYWNTTYLFNVTGLGKDAKALAYFVGAKVYGSDSFRSIFPEGSSSAAYSKIVKVLNTPPKSFPKLKGLLGGMVHLIEMVGGFYRGKKVFEGLNDFLSMAEIRLKLMQQLLVSERDNTTQLLLKKSGIKKWAKNVIGRRGSMVTFNQLLTQLMKFVFHQRFPVFGPPYKPAYSETKQKTVRRSRQKKVTPKDLLRLIEKAIQESDQLRGAISAGDVSYAVLQKNQCRHIIATCVDLAIKYEDKGYDTKSVVHFLRTAFSAMSAVTVKRDNRLLSLSREAALLRVAKAIHYLEAALDAAQSGLKRTIRSTASVTYTEQHQDRLGLWAITPELVFSPPPRCNVIFPDFYTQLQVNRAFLNEPTRMMLRAGEVRKGDIFTGGYSKMKVFFAPDTATVRGAVKMGTKEFAKSVMPHEVYTGIIPSQMELPWAGSYRLKAKGRREYVQRLANYFYLTQRYGQRAASITGIFMPNLIPGLPVLIIDKYVEDAKTLEEYSRISDDAKRREYLKKVVPEQYLGVITAVSHTLKYDLTQTAVNVSMLRTHREQLEALGHRKVKIRKRIGTEYVMADITAWVTVCVSNQFPQGSHKKLIAQELGGIVQKMILVKANATSYPSGSTLIWKNASGTTISQNVRGKHRGCKGGGWTERDINPGFEEFTGAEELSKSSFPIVSAAAKMAVRHFLDRPACYSSGETSEKVHYGANIYKVKVSFGKGKVPRGIYITQERELTFEELVTPPWLGKVWQPPEIDKTYQELFGVGSIMEELTISEPSDIPEEIVEVTDSDSGEEKA